MKCPSFIAPGVALVVNIFLFALLPLLVQSDLSKSDLETIVPVHWVEINPEELQPKKQEKPPNKPPPEKVIPTVSLQHNIPKKEIEMEMPRFSFEINPRLAAGIPIAAPDVSGNFYEQGDVDQVPMAVFKMKPLYPYRARRLNIAGNVDVKFLVDEKGCVSDIKILKSSPPGVFEESVRKALVSWRFSPGELDGRSVSTWVVTTIEFDMEGI
ncbi:MAG: hypothetical protein BA865_06080 [Desulfobacterales bacterium S5133MH4]|nr:MAG: hypothetical protein BA865_06080 [Desulfobacterales bacterium S5133MH4]